METFLLFLWHWLKESIVVALGLMVIPAIVILNTILGSGTPITLLDIRTAFLICGVLGLLTALSPAVASLLTKNESRRFLIALFLCLVIGAVAGTVVAFFELGVITPAYAPLGSMVIFGVFFFWSTIVWAINDIVRGLRKKGVRSHSLTDSG